MKISALLIALISFSAQAHFQIGTYKGVSPEGMECEVKFESVAFTTAFKNPLAERVTVTAMGKTFVLQHLAKVDESSVSFSEASLETTLPILGGAEHFKVNMIETESKEGPDSYVHMIHDWKKNKVMKMACESLVFQGE